MFFILGIKFFYFLLTHLNILLASLLPSTDKSNNLSLQSQAGNYTAPFSHDIHRSQIHKDHNRMADTFPLQFLDIRTIHTRTYNKISIYKYHLINRDAKMFTLSIPITIFSSITRLTKTNRIFSWNNLT